MYTYICKEVAKLVCKCINKFYFSKIYAKFSISGKHCRTFLMRHANLHLTQKQAGMVRNFSLKLMTSKFKWKVRWFLKDFAWAIIDNIPSVSRFRFTLIVAKYKHSIKIWLFHFFHSYHLLEPWNEFVVAWQISFWLLSISFFSVVFFHTICINHKKW